MADDNLGKIEVTITHPTHGVSIGMSVSNLYRFPGKTEVVDAATELVSRVMDAFNDDLALSKWFTTEA